MNNKTIDSYLKLAIFFYKKNGLTEDNITPKKITDALLNCAIDYRPAYWRKLRNALEFDQARQGFKHSAKRIKDTKNPLTKPDAPEMLKRQIKAKQKRVKSVDENDYSELLIRLKGKPDEPLRAALVIANRVGCRPVEMLGIKQVSDDVIFIKGAKSTEKGDRGLSRKLKLEPKDVRLIVSAVKCLNEAKTHDEQKGLKSDFIHRIQSRLSTLTKSTFPKRKSQISLYSFRHQLGGNLKASGIDRVSIAYTMGHQSTASVDVYGDKRKVSGRIAVAPAATIEEQKLVVRVMHEKPLSAQVKQAPVHQKRNDFDNDFSM